LQPDREQELVRRAQGGDKEAFASLVLKHQLFVYNLALRALGSAQEAEDVSQEAFVRAWVGLGGFRGQSQFRTWLYRIVTNLCYNRVPRLRRELAALGDDDLIELADESFRDPAYQLVDAERRNFLHRQIERLPDSYRILITLRFQQDLSYGEIAQVLNLPLGTVKTGLFRARARLKEALTGYEGVSG
jgi:RNA polymerase sigma-70 factor (ECF subfamily)